MPLPTWISNIKGSDLRQQALKIYGDYEAAKSMIRLVCRDECEILDRKRAEAYERRDAKVALARKAYTNKRDALMRRGS